MSQSQMACPSLGGVAMPRLLLIGFSLLFVLTLAPAQEAKEGAAFEAGAAGFSNLRIERDRTRPGHPVIGVHFTYSSQKVAGSGRRQLVTDAVVKELSGLTQLQSLTLEFTEVTDA